MSFVAVADGSGLHVRARGLARLWGCSRGPDIARRAIAGASLQGWGEVVSQLGWRVGGTGVPRKFAAGWFTITGRRGERAWLYADRGTPLLCVQTPPGERPALVVISLHRIDVRPDADWMP